MPMKSWFHAIFDGFYTTFVKDDRYFLFVEGFANTVLISIFACLLGIILGTIVALVKVSQNKNNFPVLKFFSALCDLYITIIRGTPVVLQLLIMYFLVFTSTTNGLVIAVLTFGINSGAYVAEIIRAGILSVEKGQMEAGRSLGLNQATTMRRIVLPQALKNILPALGNEFIALLKETAVVGYVGVIDLTKAADLTRSLTFDVFPALTAVALVYLFLVVLLTKGMKFLEKRLAQSDKH